MLKEALLGEVGIQEVISIARSAGKEIMNIYGQEFQVEFKEDKSPLTEADRKSNEIINYGLKKIDQQIPILSEENKNISYTNRENWQYFWLVDPLDGTKEFIKKNGEFTVNIALIYERKPILGVVYIPAKDIIYYAQEGLGSYKQNGDNAPSRILSQKRTEKDHLKVIASRSHLTQEVEEYVEEKKKEYQHVEFVSAGSSLKFCYVAEGKADVYPRLAPTMEWDTAAGQAIATFAGRKVYNYHTGEELFYNKKNLLNDWFVVE
ncbi:MAG: 3'(2'),5'-bisphosphate nucleotidase CysQ [Candidatus Margulisbacteria bacterium]|nr:3'(2'),5'-bisphosphate nucleotidase CysQ [Candidatus Margulisiibacteriota bacterium]